MGENVGVPAGGLLDDSPDLVPRVLRVIDGIGRGGYAAGCHDLDRVRALPELLAGGLANAVDAVRHVGQPVGLDGARVQARVILQGPLVAVAPRLAEGAPAVEDSRPSYQPPVHGGSQAIVAPGSVANRREAPGQHTLQDDPRLMHDEGYRLPESSLQVHRRDSRVDVGVDQPGHQRPFTRVQGQGVPYPDGLVGDLRDPVVLHQHVVIGEELPSPRVQQGAVFEQDEAHRSQPSRDEYAGSGRAITSPWAGGSPLRRPPS